MSAQFTLRGRLRQLVLVLAALIVLVAAIAGVFLAQAAAEVHTLTTVNGPAVDSNGRLLQSMTDAETGLRGYAASRDPVALGPYSGAEPKVQADLADLDRLLGAGPQRWGEPLALQRAAVTAWWRYARAGKATLDRGGHLDVLQGKLLLDRVRLANGRIDTVLREQRQEMRLQARRTLLRAIWVLSGATLAAVAIALFSGYRIAGSLTAPLADLRAVVRRQREGDSTARADTGHGAADLRALGEDFNHLSEESAQLQQAQAEAIALHRMALDLAARLRSCRSTQEALDTTTAVLGAGLHADHLGVIANPTGSWWEIVSAWRAPGVKELGELSQVVLRGAGDLQVGPWSSSETVAVHDLMADAYAESVTVRELVKSSQARSLAMTPIALGGRVIGVIAALTLRPRCWSAAQSQALQQAASHTARAFVEAEYSAHQNEHLQRLQRLDEQKNAFMATVSHELRTPLTSINGYLELLREGDLGDLDPPQQRALDVIGRNTLRLRGLIEDLLVLNRIESQGLELSFHPVQFRDLVAHVVESLAPVAARQQVLLNVLPCPDGALVCGDAGQLERALTNIIGNAVKFTPAGGEVTIEVVVQDSQVRLTCTDTGIGIPAADVGHLFTRFFRASNAAERTIPGTGLGLSIVKAIAQAHRGQVELDSTEGRGTTVVLALPREGA